VLVLAASPAGAQVAGHDDKDKSSAAKPASGNEPVTFLADRVTYDKTNGIVTAEGHVQAWQNGHYLTADRVTFDRNTNVAAAHGHVVIVEPDGEVVFGDYAEVTEGMKNGIITNMRALLAENGKLAANGARRTEGKLNEMARGVYTACDACKKHPRWPPEWQLRSDHMTQDLEHKRIEYTDAWLDVFGVPVLYLPYMSNTDPSVKRQSGLLIPSLGFDSEHLGTYLQVPYYWVLNDQSDLTVSPLLSTQQGGEVQAEYRLWLNEGRIDVNTGVGHDNSPTTTSIGATTSITGTGNTDSIDGYLFATANFSWDDTWRYGTNINVSNSATYLRDYEITPFVYNFLPTTAFIEGFGVGAYSKLDVAGWQGLNATITQSTLPYVLPRYTYDFLSQPDFWGGRFSFDTVDFNVFRGVGTDTRRLAGHLAWERPFAGLLGEQYDLTAEVTGAAYNATFLNEQPNFGDSEESSALHAEPQVALKMNWPFVRDAGSLGTQIVEPIVQLIAGPQTGNSVHDRLPNEDSLDYEFTDATLFSRNRYGGYDRFDGGARANFALHGNWTFTGGQVLDAMVGASAIEHIDHNLYPQFQPWNGFATGSHLSDIVGRASFAANKWVNFTARARVDHNNGDLHFADAVMGLGPPVLHANVGYFYSSTNPYELYLSPVGNTVGNVFYYDSGNYLNPGYLVPTNKAIDFFTPRSEVTLGLGSKIDNFTFGVDTMRNLATNQFDTVKAHFRYEDECTALDILFARRYTSILGDSGNTTLLFTITLKTVGSIPFK
jgi:LPS-assembly protein